MEDYNNSNELTARDYVKVLFRHKGLIFISILTVMLTVISALMLNTPVYQGQVKMLISGLKQAQAAYYTDIAISGMRSMQITQTQSEIVTSDPVIERAVRVLKFAERPFDYEAQFASSIKKLLIDLRVGRIQKQLERVPKEQQKLLLQRIAMEDLRQRVDVEPVRDTDLFLIKVTDFNPVAAAITANVVSRSYAIYDLEQQLAEMQLKYGEKHLAVVQLKEAIDKMSLGLNGAILPPMEAIGPATVKIIEQAHVPLRPSGIPPLLIVILGFFMSVFVSIMLASGFEYMDQTFRSPREVEPLLGVSYLGSLPVKATKRAYHDLSEHVYLAIKDRGIKSILFCSVMHQEGVTEIVSNLAVEISQNFNKKVLLIDADLRNPQIYNKFNLPESNDLESIVLGKLAPENAVKVVNENLHVVISGTAEETPSPMRWLTRLFRRKPSGLSGNNPMSILESQSMKDFIKEAREFYDLVLLDSAPLGEYKDATIISTATDGVVMVVNERKTRRHVAKNALDKLKARKASILGVILNKRTFAVPKVIYDRV